MEPKDEANGDRGTPKMRGNPLTASSLGGRVLSASQLPWFLIRPPRNYGVLETVGRRSGQRRRCLRIVEDENQAGIVAIGGQGVGWLANLTKTPQVRIRTRGGWRPATAQVVVDFPEALRTQYEESSGAFCYGEYLMWRSGRPATDGIRDLHVTWLDTGVLVLLDLTP